MHIVVFVDPSPHIYTDFIRIHLNITLHRSTRLDFLTAAFSLWKISSSSSWCTIQFCMRSGSFKSVDSLSRVARDRWYFINLLLRFKCRHIKFDGSTKHSMANNEHTTIAAVLTLNYEEVFCSHYHIANAIWSTIFIKHAQHDNKFWLWRV